MTSSRGALEELDRSGTTANDRFKAEAGPRFWAAMILAAAVHFALFAFSPGLTIAEIDHPETDEPIHLSPPPDVDLPPAPEPLPEPAVPIISSTEFGDAPTIEPTTLPEDPVGGPPPPPERAEDPSDGREFVPVAVRPELRDPATARRIVESEYPRLLKDAGIYGEVVVWAFIDEEGRVRHARIDRSSGVSRLDAAALRAVRRFEYSPAVNRDREVPVWIQQRIIFTLR